MESILHDIKTGSFNRIYLLYGEESYLRNLYKNKLKNALVSQDNPINISEFSGKSVNVTAVINAALTMPFFADKTVIIVSDTNLFTTSQDELSEFLKDVPETTVIIFCEDKVDKKFKLFKACSKYGRVVEFPKLDETKDADIKKLHNYVLSYLKKNNLNITYEAMDLLIKRTGTGLEGLFNELDKLISYTAGRDSIQIDDVKALVPERMEDKIFDMIDAVSKRKQSTALSLYYDLVRKKEAPVKILTLIERHYNQIYIYKSIYERTKNEDEALRAAKIPSFKPVIAKYRTLASSYSMSALKSAVEMCLELDEAFKTGKIKDSTAVELVIVKMSQAA